MREMNMIEDSRGVRISESECSGAGRALTRRVGLLKGLTHRGFCFPTEIGGLTQLEERFTRPDVGTSRFGALRTARAS